MLEEVVGFTWYNRGLKKIIFVLFNEKAYRTFKEVFKEHLDRIKKKIERHPVPAVDIIIEKDGAIILVERKNPPFGWALPGGFVEVGESVETAAGREAEEETGIKVRELKQFHVYSKPDRDPRFHTISCVFTAGTEDEPKAASDAKKAEFFREGELPDEITFDHRRILSDYFKSRKGK
ncbi:MAG: NUDIX domain-containing protein [Candidatus Omnitrophica bacterium]|nr:NUDIX domain-containing protein [Candidatus Omnitrophota bacterium]